jgi:hypothetical protein
MKPFHTNNHLKIGELPDLKVVPIDRFVVKVIIGREDANNSPKYGLPPL